MERLRRVHLEITNKEREDWFFDRLWKFGSTSWDMALALGIVSRTLDEARKKGYPKPRPKRYRISRSALGQILEEVRDDED
jgi:hypothetical protein